MKKYALYALSLIIVANIILSYWIFNFKGSVRSGFSCISNHRMIHGDITIQASYLFRFDNTNSSVKISGIVMKNNVPLSDIGRVVDFNYQSLLNNQFSLTSSRIQKLPLTNEADSVLTEHLPAFFVESNKKITLRVIRSDHQDYVLMMAGVPAFYCDII